MLLPSQGLQKRIANHKEGADPRFMQPRLPNRVFTMLSNGPNIVTPDLRNHIQRAPRLSERETLAIAILLRCLRVDNIKGPGQSPRS